MKDSISIIFAAIIGTFLIVILPLYSILDRQDSMSYNVVLTATTNFVDDIRNKGFIDREAYRDYLGSLASTSNTYKVTIEAYKKVLINETNEKGEKIDDSFIEEKELYNTQDILDVLENDNSTTENNSSIKNNIYLLSKDDEIYVRVYNTNVTTGSIIYSMLAGNTNTEVINISYGGIVNDVNWELYDKINSEQLLAPEVVMSVPVNADGNTNIQKVDITGELEDMGCNIENSEDFVGVSELEQLCEDIRKDGDSKYTYLYDLTKSENKTIKIAVELRRFAKIDIGTEYIDVSELEKAWFNGSEKTEIERHIIKNYIVPYGMYANIDLKLRGNQDYYVFEIEFTDVTMSDLAYISSLAHIEILPGLGIDENGIESMLAESVEIELLDTDAVNMVGISPPIIWQKYIATKNLAQSTIRDNVVYVNEEIAFVISYTGIKAETQDIKEALRQNFKTQSGDIDNLKFYTGEELETTYGIIDLGTTASGHVLVKFNYTSPNDSKENYVILQDKWINTNVPIYDPETEETVEVRAMGAKSQIYEVKVDNLPPIAPSIIPEGTEGNNGWYTGDEVNLIIQTSNDTIRQNGVQVIGGSGVQKSTVVLYGATTLPEETTNTVKISNEGITNIIARAYDYVGNISETEYEIKLDKSGPTAPTIQLTGTKGRDGWYTDKVSFNITPGTDNVSGVNRTTYRIEGANNLGERVGTSGTITTSGTSTIIATTYDNAGNSTETRMDVKVDTSVPPESKIEVIKGDKNLPQNTWYYTDVTLRVTVDASSSVSGLGTSRYEINNGYTIKTEEFTGNTTEIELKENGTHKITVYTYTGAGKWTEKGYTVKIDKNAPNQPTIKINSGQLGENNWYITNVELQVISNGDNGPSGMGENNVEYEIGNSGRTPITSNGKIFFNNEGEYQLKIYVSDMAGNEITETRTIKIDKTKPTSAEFVIAGTKGNDDWYISNVYLSHKGAADAVSGIQSVTLSKNSITRNTNGTKVTLTTKDNAGHTVEKEITIKLDKSVPTQPTINISPSPTGNAQAPWQAYNTYIKFTIKPGVDTFLSTGDNVNIETTTYEIINASTQTVIVSETNVTSGKEYQLPWNGKYTIYARTKDKAGNVSVTTKNVWINTNSVQAPKIISINGVNVENDSSETITSESNIIKIETNNIAHGNTVTVILTNSNYERDTRIITYDESKPIEITLNNKGKYYIQITQTNMFGTTSGLSIGDYYYNYK